MSRTRYLAQAGAIAAVYAALTLAVLQAPAQLGWGFVQFRLSEAVTVLAVLTPAAIPGLAIGAALANSFNLAQMGTVALLDVVFGALGSGLGAAWSWRFRRNTPLALAGPVVANALIVPAYLPTMLGAIGVTEIPFIGVGPRASWLALYGAGVLTVGLGQAVVVYGLGWPLLVALRRTGMFRLTDDRRP